MKYLTLVFLLALFTIGCDDRPPTSDQVQAHRQEQVTKELASAMGMPSVKNGAEMRLLKMIYEMRDTNRATFTYTYSEYNGKFRFLGNTIGFGIPYAAQYSSPTKIHSYAQGGSANIVAQSEPNGLFMPASADGTWVLMKDSRSDDVLPVYIEPKITVSPFKLPANMVMSE